MLKQYWVVLQSRATIRPHSLAAMAKIATSTQEKMLAGKRNMPAITNGIKQSAVIIRCLSKKKSSKNHD